jgi:hypothetical protein
MLRLFGSGYIAAKNQAPRSAQYTRELHAHAYACFRQWHVIEALPTSSMAVLFHSACHAYTAPLVTLQAVTLAAVKVAYLPQQRLSGHTVPPPLAPHLPSIDLGGGSGEGLGWAWSAEGGQVPSIYCAIQNAPKLCMTWSC